MSNSARIFENQSDSLVALSINDVQTKKQQQIDENVEFGNKLWKL